MVRWELGPLLYFASSPRWPKSQTTSSKTRDQPSARNAQTAACRKRDRMKIDREPVNLLFQLPQHRFDYGGHSRLTLGALAADDHPVLDCALIHSRERHRPFSLIRQLGLLREIRIRFNLFDLLVVADVVQWNVDQPLVSVERVEDREGVVQRVRF